MKPLQRVEHTIQDMASLKRSFVFWGFVTTMALGALLSWWRFPILFSDPDAVFVGKSQEQTAAYFTTAWHVRYDSAFAQYNGMNYPYGEHIAFAHNQPLVSDLLRWWTPDGAVAGILHLMEALFIVLGCGVVFLLLSKLHLPLWYSMAGALIITFLSPPLQAFSEHSTWAQPFVIPLLLYWLCRYEERMSRRYQSLHLAGLMWLSAMVQPGYFGISVLFLTAFTAFQLLRKPTRSNIFRRLSHWVVMTLIPLVLLNVWIHWAHFSPDRPAATDPTQLVFIDWKALLLPGMDYSDQRLKTYAGGIALLYALSILLSGFQMFGKSWSGAAYHRVHCQYLRGILIAAIFLLLPALGTPFFWEIALFLRINDTAPYAWFFFYTVNLLAIYGAWNYGKRFKGFGEQQRVQWLKYVFMSAPLAILGWDAVHTHLQAPPLHVSPNLLKKENAIAAGMPWINKVNFTNYQALLPLPYYHQGSGVALLPADSAHFNRVAATAYHSGLPDMGVFLKQTPLSDALELLELALTPGEIPLVLAEMPDQKPLLALVDQKKWTDIQAHYPHLVQKSVTVYRDSLVRLLRVEPDSIRSNIRAQVQNLAAVWNNAQELGDSGWRSNRTDAIFYTAHYDEQRAGGATFQGKGSLGGRMCDTVRLWRGTIKEGVYRVNCWIRISGKAGADHHLHITTADGLTRHFPLRSHLRSVIKGWGLFEVEVAATEGVMDVFLQKSGICDYFFADELLIRPADTDLYRKESGWISKNNFWFREE